MLALLVVVAALRFGALFCPMAMVLHIPCPGCGMTRATLAALRGDFGAAFRFHPLAVVITPFVGAYTAASAISYVYSGVSKVDRFLNGKWWNRGIFLLFAAILGVWISRFFGAFGGPVPV